MVVQLLSLRRHRAKESPPGIDQVLPPKVFFPVDKKVLLLCADRGLYGAGTRIAEEAEQAERLPAERLHGAKERCLFVKRLSGKGAKRRRNAESHILPLPPEEGGACAVPDRIAPGLKGGPEPAGGKGGGIRLAPDKLPSGKFEDRLPLGIHGGEEAVVLLRRNAVQGLKPVGIMARSILYGPLPHRLCHGIRDRRVQLIALLHGLSEPLID